MAAYKHLDLTVNAKKVLETRDGDIEKIRKLYNVSAEEQAARIASVRDWYEKQPHLPQGQLADRMILGQLITRAFSVEKVKDNIDAYFGARHKMPEVLRGWDPMPDIFVKTLLNGSIVLLPTRTSENHRIIVVRVVNPEIFSIFNMTKLGILFRDYRLFNDTSPAEHWIIDLTNSIGSHYEELTPDLIIKWYYHTNYCSAPEFKGLHYVNHPPSGDKSLGYIKKLLKPEHSPHLHFHDSFEKVFDHLPREVFPKELGGSADITCVEIGKNMYEAIQSEPWKQFLKHMDKYFYTDESKRTTPAKVYSDMFEADGSFRQLEK